MNKWLRKYQSEEEIAKEAERQKLAEQAEKIRKHENDLQWAKRDINDTLEAIYKLAHKLHGERGLYPDIEIIAILQKRLIDNVNGLTEDLNKLNELKQQNVGTDASS